MLCQVGLLAPQTTTILVYWVPVLLSHLLAQLPEGKYLQLGNDTSAEERLRLWIAEATREFSFSVDDEVFAAHVGQCLSRCEAAERYPWETLQGPDLYLCCGCLQGDQTAVEYLEKHFSPEVMRAIAKLDMDGAKRDDVKQLVWERLLSSDPGKEPKLKLYTGVGPLRYWIRSVSARTALNELRRRNREFAVEDDKLLRHASEQTADPELAYLKTHYQEKFKEAFASAVATLDDRSTNILRYHHIDGLSIDEIGRIYSVHRVTAYRWLDKAKSQLAHQVEKLLREQLGLSDEEFDSVVRLVRSRLALSITRHFASSGPQTA